MSFLPNVVFFIILLFHDTDGDNLRRQRPRYTENERQLEYKKRGYQWPIQTYVPDTEGWKSLMDRRLDQIMANPQSQERWDGMIQTMSAALTVPNFTEFGWGLTHAPDDLTQELQIAIGKGLPKAREEGNIEVIDGPRPLFIDRPDLTSKVLHELQPILEAWAGIELEPYIAYGFRLYRNESRLWMHVDRTRTHVISCIYHIASSEDSKPWPVVIEDYDGNTNSVVLKPGDILLYESAKNFHGRPSYFQGEWYTSVFVHFYPKEGWLAKDRDIESHYAVPPNWQDMKESIFPKLKWIGTSSLEPDCPESWCHLINAKEWEGPGEYGKVLTAQGKKYSLGLSNVVGEEIENQDSEQSESQDSEDL